MIINIFIVLWQTQHHITFLNSNQQILILLTKAIYSDNQYIYCMKSSRTRK